MKDEKLKQSAVLAAVVLGVLGIYLVGGNLLGYFIAKPVEEEADTDLDSFARCLTEKGAVLYGLPTCGYCIQQKGLFGDAFEHIEYVDCSIYQQTCQEKGVTGVPSWEVDGNIEAGLKTIEKLGEMYGCPLN